uniref:HAT C-terminal dimerisation domain-containing protein n=1 Tax=Chenopodium quinoa TaxID=63459 RepID=A0A803N5A4_CHEQI
MTECWEYDEDPKLDRKAELDILAFWKENEHRYKDLSHLARDILAVPLTTVASESTFSIWSRVLNKWKSSSIPEKLEALITTRNWMYSFEMNASANIISANINTIPMLDGTNFKSWKENVMIVLGCMDLDLALRVERPIALTDSSSSVEKGNMEKWERSNRMSLMIMKRAIPESFRGTMSEEDDAKSFLTKLEKLFDKNEKAEISTLLSSLVFQKYEGTGNIREYIMEMSHIASKLKALNQFKVSYNCQKEKWTLNELISHCVQEEERLKQEKTKSAHLTSSSKDGKKRKKGKDAVSQP